MTGHQPEVSAIIPTRSGGARLAGAVAALGPGPDREIILVLNGADPRTVEDAGRIEGVTLVRSEVNRGFGGGIQLGAERASGRVLLLTHDDAVVDPGAVDALVAVLQRHDRLGAVSGVVRTPLGDGELSLMHGSVVRPDGWTCPISEPPSEPVFAVDYAGTALLAVRADAFAEAGGMDPGFFPAYFTDVDLAFRLRAAGWWVGCATDAGCLHTTGSSTSLPFRTFVGARNHARFLHRWGHAVARRADLDPEDVDVLRAAAEQDRLEALARSAPLPMSSPPIATGDAWFVERAAEVDRAFRQHLAALERSAAGDGEASL